jgi:hypothetical protein
VFGGLNLKVEKNLLNLQYTIFAMDWLRELLFNESVAHTILIYCVVISVGVSLGKVKILGVSMGPGPRRLLIEFYSYSSEL